MCRGAVLVGVIAMFVRRYGVLFGFDMTTVIVMMSRLAVVMGGEFMVRRRHMMMLGRMMLRFCHENLLGLLTILVDPALRES